MKGKSSPPVGDEESLHCTIHHASDVSPTPPTSLSAAEDPPPRPPSSLLTTEESCAMKGNAGNGIGSDGRHLLGALSEGEKDPPVDEYSSNGSTSSSRAASSSSSSGGPRQPIRFDTFLAEGDYDDRSSGSRSSSGTGSTVEFTGLVSSEPPTVRSPGSSPLASTPLRTNASIPSDFHGDQHPHVSSEGGDGLNASTAMSASPMGPHVRRILEALASFDGSPDDAPVTEHNGATSTTDSRGDVVAPETHIRRPERVKNTVRSVSGSSEASSSKNQSKKKKPRTEYSTSVPYSDTDQELTNAEMLDISAIISQVDRKSLDDELDQLVRELDEAVGHEVEAFTRGIKLRRRRRGRKGRRGKWRKGVASLSNDPTLSDDASARLNEDGGDDDAEEESQSSDPRARAFRNMVAAEDWMAREAYSSEDSVIEDSSYMTTQTEEPAKEIVQGPPAADAANESSAFQALRDAWSSFTFAPLFDATRGADTETNRPEESKTGAVEATETEVPKIGPEGPHLLEFIDPAFFEELWKALLSIQIQNCRPLDYFQTQTPAGDSTLSTKEPHGEGSVSSTIPTDAPSFDACDSLSICSGTVPTDEGIDHSAILAKCLARSGAGGKDDGAAGSSPLAKRKAALLLQQCEKKFPSLYKRIIARLESKAGVKASDADGANEPDVGTPQPSRIDSDEGDSLLSTSRANTSTTAELANKTPRVRNSRRDISVGDLSASESPEDAREGALAFESQETNAQNASDVLIPFPAAFPKVHAEQANPSLSPGTDASKLLVEYEFNDVEDLQETRDYALLTSFTASAVDDDSPPRVRTLDRLTPADPSPENFDHLTQGIVSPLTVDSHVFQESETLDVGNQGIMELEPGAEVTDILADLTTTDFGGLNKATNGEGEPAMRVQDLSETLQKKVPILTPKSSDTSRPRRIRHSSVPRGIHRDIFSDPASDDHDHFPVILKHRFLSHAAPETRKATSRLKPRKLEGFLDGSTTPKSRESTSRSLSSPDERRSPTSFPSLFRKGSVGRGGNKWETLRGPEIGRDDCPDEAQPGLQRATLSRSVTLPSPTRPIWSTFETPPRSAFNDSTTSADKDVRSMFNESLPSPVGGHDLDDIGSLWVAFPTPPRGTFRGELEGDNVPILSSSSSDDPFGNTVVPLKGTGKPSAMAVRRMAVTPAGRSKSSGRAGGATPRESALRMMASRPISSSAEAPKARFRRLVSPVSSAPENSAHLPH